MTIILHPNRSWEIPEVNRFPIRDEECLSCYGDCRRFSIGVDGGGEVLIVSVSASEERSIGFGSIDERGIEGLFAGEEGRRSVRGRGEDSSNEIFVDGRHSSVEFGEGDGFFDPFCCDEMSVNDVVDVSPVEEILIVANLEFRLARLENVEESWESLTISWTEVARD